MAPTSWAPSVRARLVVTERHRATGAAGELMLEVGTALEVEDLVLRWDNRHAMIWRPYMGNFWMRVLDGHGADERIEVEISGAAIDADDRENDRIELPTWLAATGGGAQA